MTLGSRQIRIPVPRSVSVVPPNGGPGVHVRNEEEASFVQNPSKFFDLTLALAYVNPAVLAPLQDVRLVNLTRLGIGPVELTLLVTMLATVKTGHPIPSWAGLKAKIFRKVSALGAEHTGDIDPVFNRIMSLMVDRDRDVGLVMRFTGWVRRETEIVPAVAQAMKEVEDGRSTVEQAAASLQELRNKELPLRSGVNPLDYSRTYTGEAFSSGLPWLDEVLGGGFRKGSGYSCIAVTGGCKTTLAFQITYSTARAGRKVLFISSEQTFRERALVNRLWSCCTGIPFSRFEHHKGNEPTPPEELVPPDTRDHVQAVLKNVTFFDFAENPGTLEDIEALIANAEPDLVILDWAGTLADQLYAMGKYKDMHLAVGSVADSMRHAATRGKCATLTFHQIAPNLGRNPFGNYDHSGAMYCKAFSVNMSVALVMTPPDPNMVFKIRATKSRYGANKETFVRLDPNVARLLPLDGSVRRGKGSWVAGEAGTIPETRKPMGRSDGGFAGA